MLITGRCSGCGSKVAELDDDVLTWNDSRPQRSRTAGSSWGGDRLTHEITTSTFHSAMKRGDIEAHCPNPKCRCRYVMAAVVGELRQARHDGKASTKLRHTVK